MADNDLTTTAKAVLAVNTHLTTVDGTVTNLNTRLEKVEKGGSTGGGTGGGDTPGTTQLPADTILWQGTQKTGDVALSKLVNTDWSNVGTGVVVKLSDRLFSPSDARYFVNSKDTYFSPTFPLKITKEQLQKGEPITATLSPTALTYYFTDDSDNWGPYTVDQKNAAIKVSWSAQKMTFTSTTFSVSGVNGGHSISQDFSVSFAQVTTY